MPATKTRPTKKSKPPKKTYRRTVAGREIVARNLNSHDEPPVSVALLDADGFHAVNRDLGRETGDLVLERLTKTLEAEVGDRQVVRTGGDEFACLFPGQSAEATLLQMEEIRKQLTSRSHRAGGFNGPIPISVGVANWPQHVEEAADLITAADEAMHRAKREGGNRVMIYSEDKMVLKSNYYPRAQLDRLGALAKAAGKTEASLLREGLESLLEKYSDQA